ncbi:MAG TPA: N-acetylmuramoyl-L-alanine amidase, partial [Kineosporiaceae bacterium]
MHRALHSSLLTIAAVPVLLAVPVAALPGVTARPGRAPAVTPRVRTIALTGVDGGALGQLRAAAARTAPRGTSSAVVAPTVLTAPQPTGRFDLVAVSWSHRGGPAVTAVSVRVRQGGTWSAWTALDPDGDGPDPGSPDAVQATRSAAPDSTAPLMTAGADGVQVRVDTATGTPPPGLTLDLVDGGTSAADAGGAAGGGAGGAGPGPAATAAAATPEPQIIDRSAWGADESLVKAAPVVNASVRAIVLHHTDTLNSYTPEQAFAQVRSLYAFHTTVRGWNDVGYNFIVDRYGRVFEGRRGSITRAVMGAHAGGFNAQTLGIAVLGTFSTTRLPAAVENALVPLVAWKSAEFGVDPAGRTTLTSAGGSYTRYAAGTRVPVYGLVGHRDVDSTECPGDAAYPRLPSLRTRAAALMVPDLVAPSLTGGPTSVAGRAVLFTATIPTRQRWWMTVTRMCGGEPVRVVSGTSTDRIAGSWDLRDAAGHPVPPGPYRVTVTSSSPVGSVPPFGQDVEVLATPESLASAAPPWGPAGPPSPLRAAAPGPPGTPGSVAVRAAGGLLGAPVVVGSPPTVAEPTSRIPQRVISPTPDPTTAPPTTAPPTTAPPTTTGPDAAPDPLGPVAASNGCPVQRAAAEDPAVTSVVAGRLAHPDARDVVLVNGSTAEGLAQGLTAATLAAGRSAPVLLTGTTALPPAVAQDVAARHATAAWLVGSPAVIAASVEQQLRSLGVTTVTRVAGADRWSTAAAVAAAVGAPAGQAVLVSGDGGEATALVAAASAAAAGLPVLLTSRAGVPAQTLAALADLRVTAVSVVGSVAAVPERTLDALAAAGVRHRIRVTAGDRWATAVAIADRLGSAAPSDRVVLASGEESGADLLVASGQARRLLLAAGDQLPAATAGWLGAHSRLGVSLV